MSKKRITISNRMVAMLPGYEFPGPENLLIEIRKIVEQIYTLAKKHLPGNESFFVSFAIVHEEGWAKELFDVKATWNCIEYTTLNKNGVLFAYEVDNERVDHDVKFDYPLACFVLEALRHKFHQEPCFCLGSTKTEAADAPTTEVTEAVHFSPHGPKSGQFPFVV